MTIYTWPTSRHFVPATHELRVVDNTQRTVESSLSGYVQTNAMPGARWGWGMDMTAHTLAQRAEVEAYLLRLNGRQHRVQLWDLSNPLPRGTISRTGVTLGASAAQFATSLTLNGCGANTTLLAGDWLSVAGGQLLRVVADATANASGVMVVEVRHMLRSAVASGSAVTLNKPTALYVRTETGLALPRQPGNVEPGLSLDFVEVFS
jgi:hypothetical protein